MQGVLVESVEDDTVHITHKLDSPAAAAADKADVLEAALATELEAQAIEAVSGDDSDSSSTSGRSASCDASGRKRRRVAVAAKAATSRIIAATSDNVCDSCVGHQERRTFGAMLVAVDWIQHSEGCSLSAVY